MLLSRFIFTHLYTEMRGNYQSQIFINCSVHWRRCIVISNASAKLSWELTNCILLFYIKVSEEEIKDIYQLYENTWEDLLQFHWVRRLNYFPRFSKVWREHWCFTKGITYPKYHWQKLLKVRIWTSERTAPWIKAWRFCSVSKDKECSTLFNSLSLLKKFTDSF